MQQLQHVYLHATEHLLTQHRRVVVRHNGGRHFYEGVGHEGLLRS